jgi:uncharacterized membrane protein
MHKFLVKSLVLFYLFSSYLSATHTHDISDTQENCKVCIFVKNFQSGDVVIPLVLVLIFSHYFTLFFNTLIFRMEVLKGFNSHAPPLSYSL